MEGVVYHEAIKGRAAFFAAEWLDVLKLPMTVTARTVSTVPSALPARRRLIRNVRRCSRVLKND